MNKLIGSLIGYKVGSLIKRATVSTVVGNGVVIKDEATGGSKVISKSQIKWVNS